MGTSGLLSPYSDMKGLYFDNSDEPDDFSYQLDQDLQKIMKEKGEVYITVDCNNKDEYFDNLMKLQEINSEITYKGESKTGDYEIVEDSMKNMDEESTISNPKKKKKDKEKTEE